MDTGGGHPPHVSASLAREALGKVSTEKLQVRHEGGLYSAALQQTLGGEAGPLEAQSRGSFLS